MRRHPSDEAQYARYNRVFARALLQICSVVACCSVAQAATTYNFDNASGDGLYSNAANWLNNTSGTHSNGTPVAGDTAIINATKTVNVDVNSACASFTLNNGAAGDAVVTFTANKSLTVSGSLALGGAVGGQTGSIDMTNTSTLSVGSFSGGFPGTFTRGAGTVIITSTTQLPSNAVFSTFNNLQIGAAAAVTLRQDTTVTGTFTIAGTGSLEGGTGFALSAGAANLSGTVGATTKLTSFSAGATTINTTDVKTTGSQTYGAVTLSADTTLTGATVTFNSTVNGTKALAITGVAVFNGAVGGTNAPTSLTVSSTTTINTATINATTQDYTGAVTLTANTTLTGAVTFESTLDGTQTLAISGSAVFNGDVGVTNALASLTVSTTTTIHTASIKATTQGYTGAVTLTANPTLTGAVTFTSTVNGAQTLAITGSAVFNGDVGGTNVLTSLTVSTTTTIHTAAIKATTQGYTGAVTLTADATLTGAVTFTTTVDGAQALAITGSAVFNGAVGGTTLTSLTVSTTTTINTATIKATTQLYSGAVTLSKDTTLTGGVTFGSTVDGAQALAITGSAVFNGVVGTTALTSLSVSTTTAISTTGITTTSTQLYSGAVTLTADTTLTGSTITFAATTGTVDGTGNGTEALAIGGNASFGAAVGSGTNTKLKSLSVSGTSSIGGGAITSLNAQSYTGAVTLGADTTLTGSTIIFVATTGTVDGTGNGTEALTINGSASFGAAVGSGANKRLKFLSVSSTSAISAGTIKSLNAQTYTGAVTLVQDTTLIGSTITFSNTVDGTGVGTESLTITGNASFGGAVGAGKALEFLSVSGTTAIAGPGAIQTTTLGGGTGDQSYSLGVTLAVDTTLTGTNVSFGSVDGTGNGTESLTVTGNVVIGGSVGTANALEFVSVSGTTSINGGSVITAKTSGTGNQTYSGAVTLTGVGGTFSAGLGAILFSSTIDGVATNSQSLFVGGTTTTFNGGVGQSVSVGTLTVTSGTATNNSTITIGGSVTGSGSFTQGSSSTLNVGASIGIANSQLSCTAAGNTVNYNGTPPTISNPTGGYVNLGIAGTGAVPVLTTTAISGTLTTSGSVVVTLANNSTIGSIVVGGTSQLKAGSPLNVTNVTLNSGTFIDRGNTVNVTGNWTNNGGTNTATGTVVFKGTGGEQINGSALAESFNNMTTSTASTSLSTSGSIATITVAGNLTIGASTTFAPPATLNVAGNWSNSGTFTSNTGTVKFNGTSQLFTGNTSFYNFTDTTPGSLLTFTKFSTQTVTNTLTLTGASGNPVTLRSSQNTKAWNLVLSSNQSVSFVDVKDSNASGGTINTTSSTNSGGNSASWVFGVQGAVTWVGGSDTNWGRASNWSGGRVPDATADVTIPNTGNKPVLDFDRSVNSLSIAASGSVDDGSPGTPLNLTIADATSTLTNAGQVKGTTNINFPGPTVANGGTWAAGSTLTLVGATAGQSLTSGGAFGNIVLNNTFGATTTVALTTSAITVQAGTFDTSSKAVSCTSLTVSGGTFNATGNSLTVSGNVNINTAGTLTAPTSTFALTVGGNWSFAGTGAFNNNGGVVISNGGANQNLTSGNQHFQDVTTQNAGKILALQDAFASDGTLTLSATSGTFNANNQSIAATNVSIAGGVLTAPGVGVTFTVAGNWSRSAGTFTANGGKVTFTGAGTKNITSGGQSFFDLDCQSANLTLLDTLANAGTISVTSGKLNGALQSIAAVNVSITGGILSAPNSTFSFSVTGNWSLTGGTFTPNGGKVTFSGVGNQTITSGGQSFFDVDSTVAVSKSVALQDTFSSLGTLQVVSGGTFDGNGNIINAVNVALAGGTLKCPAAAAFNVTGNWTISGGTLTPNGGTVTFNGSGAQTLTSIGKSFNNVTLNQSAGANTLTLQDDFSCGGTLAVTRGTFQSNVKNVAVGGVSIGANGTLIAPTAAKTFTDSGNWTVTAGTFTPSAGKVSFTGASAVTVTSGGQSFFNFDNQATGGVTLADTLTCGGAVTATQKTTIGATGGTVSTATGQTYAALVLSADASLSDSGSSAIIFNGAIDGAKTLTVSTAGTTTFNGTVGSTTPLTSIAVNSGPTVINTNTVKSTGGTQIYSGAVTLASGATPTFTGSTITFSSTLNGTTAGAESVTIIGGAVFGGTVGASKKLSTLSVSVATTINTASISTTGDQTYTGAVTLGVDTATSSSAGNVIFSNTINGGQALTISATASTKGATLSGAIGNSTPLTNLTVNADNVLTLAVNISVTNRVTFNVLTGGVNQTAGILTAPNLLLTGGGTITITQPTNAIGTLAANVNGAINVTNHAVLTIGSVNGTNGIASNGNNVVISALPFTLNVNQPVDTTPVGPPNGVTSIGNFVVPAIPTLVLGKGNIALNDNGSAATVTVVPAVGQNNPTNASLIHFTVTFSKQVTGFTSASMSISLASFSAITGGPSVYDVAVTAAGLGNPPTMASVTVNAGGAVDAASKPCLASTAGTVTYDTQKPTVLSASVARVNSSPTNLQQVQYTFVFSEAMSNVVPANFTVVTTPLVGSLFPITGVTVVNVSGSGATYTVTVDTGSGDGTLSLNVPLSGTITDLAGNPLASTYIMPLIGLQYDIVKTKPAIIGITTSNADGVYNAGDSLVINVQFTKNVTLTGGNLQIPLNTGVALNIPPFGPANNVNVTYNVGPQETTASDPSDNLHVTAAVVSLGSGAAIGDNVGNACILTTPMPNFSGKSIQVNAAPLQSSPLSVSFDGSFATDQIPGIGLPNQTLTFTIGVTDLDLNPPFPVAANVLNYAWDFGDGTTATTTGATNFATHMYATAGTFTAKVTVTDGRGGTPVTSTLAISVNTPPRIDTNGIVLALNPIGFDTEESFSVGTLGMGTFDQDGDALNYLWDFGDGTTATGQNVTHTYPLDSFPKSSLGVDGTGTVTATVTITDPTRGAAAGKVVQQVTIKLLNPFGNVVSVVDDITTDDPVSGITLASKGSKGAVRFSVTGAIGNVTSTIEPSDGVSPQGIIKGFTFFALFTKPGIFVVTSTDSAGNSVRKMVPITLNETLGGERKNIAAFKSDQSFIIGRFAFNKPKSKDSVVFRGRFPLDPTLYPPGTHSFHIGLGNIIISGTVDAKGKGTATSVVDALGVDHGPQAARLFRFILDTKNQRAVLSTMVTFPNMSKGGFDSSGVVATFGSTGKNGALQPLNIQVALLIDQSLSYASLIPAGFLAKNGTGRLAGAKR